MWELAKHLLVTSGEGESLFKLNSFDNALLDANIANYNHSIQSSIIPPHCQLHFDLDLNLPAEGSILPTILSRKHGEQGQSICAGLAFGINLDPDLPGLVYELSGHNEVLLIDELTLMIQAAAEERLWRLKDIKVVTRSLHISQPHGCALVAAVLLP